MTGNLETLLNAMRIRAESDRKACRDEAEKSAREISARAEAAIDAMHKEAAADLERSLRGETRRVLGESSLYRRRKTLQARRKVADQVFERARRRLEELIQKGRHEPSLRQLLVDTAQVLGGGARLEISAADAHAVADLGPRLEEAGEIHLADVPRGTVVGTSRDGLRRIDNSLMRRLEKVRELMVDEVAQILFGGAEPAVVA